MSSKTNKIVYKLKLNIKRSEKKMKQAAQRAAQAERLLPSEAGELVAEGEMEKTSRFSQRRQCRRARYWPRPSFR